MPATLTIEGLPLGWEVVLRGQRAMPVGVSYLDPTFLAIEGRSTFEARKDGEVRSATLQVSPGANVVAWSEFRGQKSSSSDAIAGTAVATAIASVVYFVRQKKVTHVR